MPVHDKNACSFRYRRPHSTAKQDLLVAFLANTKKVRKSQQTAPPLLRKLRALLSL